MGIRRAHELDRLLDRLVAGEEPEATGDLAPFLHPARIARASLVRSLDPKVERSQIATLHEDRLRNLVAVPPTRRRGIRFAVVALVGAIVLMLGAGAATAASANAIPGDPLYGVKRAVERVSLALHRDAAGRSAVHLRFAQERLDEIHILVARHLDATGIIAAFNAELNAAEQDAEKAVALGQDSDALLAHVQEMIAKHIVVLNEVLGKVPAQAKDAIQRAIDNAQKAETKAQHGRGTGGQGSGHGKPSIPPGKSGSAPGRP